jgi:hypothetical protein
VPRRQPPPPETAKLAGFGQGAAAERQTWPSGDGSCMRSEPEKTGAVASSPNGEKKDEPAPLQVSLWRLAGRVGRGPRSKVAALVKGGFVGRLDGCQQT